MSPIPSGWPPLPGLSCTQELLVLLGFLASHLRQSGHVINSLRRGSLRWKRRRTAPMPDPIIVPDRPARAEGQHPIAATGQSFAVHEWSGSGPDYLHVHHADDEAWHIVEGTLTFRFSDRTVEAPAGTTVFVPAGVAHSYYE